MAKAAKLSNPIVLRAGMTIGANAAERDDEFLLPCFVQYPPVTQCMDMSSRGTVIEGRTGSGKTALLKYIIGTTNRSSEIDPFDMSMSYVSNSDVLSFLHAIGADLDLLFQVLWRHVLCIEFIRLRFSVADESVSRSTFAWIVDAFSRDARRQKAIAYLKEWEGKFWITMDQNIKELTEKIEKAVTLEVGAEVEKFKAGGQYDKRLSVDKKSELVARVRKIINAEQLTELANVVDLLGELVHDQQQEPYYILIDKLDENWVDVSVRFKLIRGLVESLKSFRKIRDLKILVSLRSDVLERVVQETKDLTFQREKLDDYFVHIKWTKPLLRQLVDTRIQQLFRSQYSGAVITFAHVFSNNVGIVDPFDYIVDRTLLRPRDIIAFVNECLNEAQGNFDVTGTVIKRAEQIFSAKRKVSIEQEWQSAYPTITRLMNLLASKKKSLLTLSELCPTTELDDLALSVYSEGKSGFDPFFDAAKSHCEDGPSNALAKLTVSILYRVGAVGIKLQTGVRYQFSHLDQPILPVTQIPDEDINLRVHPMLHAALHIQ
jgi:hypothetical protein